MAVTAQAGIFGFGPQGAKEQAATQFWKHKATTIDLGLMDDIRVGPLEIGSGPFPTFPYKAGYIVGGGVELQPRLEDSIGWLLYAHLGGHSVGSVTDGVYPHTFKPDTDLSNVRWLSLRKYIPQKEGDAATDLGVLFEDCKPTNLMLTLPNDAPITARWDFMGRTFTYVPDISGWTWQNSAYEDWGSIPVGCETGGSIAFTGGDLSGESLPIVNARIAFGNQNLDPRQEKVYGDPALEDVTIIRRQMTFDCTVKWNNPDVIRNIVTGSSTGVDWTSSPLTGSVDIKTVATELAGVSATQKFELDISAAELMWQLNGPVTLAAGEAIMLRLTGTALEPASGDYATFDLFNEVADYSWPAAGS